MELTKFFQTNLLFLLVNSTSFLKKVRHVVDPEIFHSDEYFYTSKVALRYFDEYKECVGENLVQELTNELERSGESVEIVPYIVKKLSGVRVNEEYILNKLSEFIRWRLMQEGVLDLAKLVSRGKLSEAELEMRRIIDTRIDTVDDGIDYLVDYSSFVERLKHEPVWMTTGIKSLDQCIGGFRKPEFVSVFGGYKGGKSWFLIHIGKVALVHGHKVLHITHEMTRSETEERYDMMIGSLVSGSEPAEVVLRNPVGDGSYKKEIIYRPSTRDFNAVMKARRSLRRYGGVLRIVKFPMGMCKTLDVESLLGRLESKYDFIPDVLINDYADIMYCDRDNLRESLNQLYIWHKSIADRWGMLVVTASQVRRDSIGRAPDERDFAEDIRKAGNVDLALGIEDGDETDEKIIHVILNRHGVQKVCFQVGTKFKIGQFCRWDQYYGMSNKDDE